MVVHKREYLRYWAVLEARTEQRFIYPGMEQTHRGIGMDGGAGSASVKPFHWLRKRIGEPGNTSTRKTHTHQHNGYLGLR